MSKLCWFVFMLKMSLGTYNVAGFTIRFLLHRVERLASELVATCHAGKTFHVEHLVHGGASSAFPDNVLTATGTAAWGEERRRDIIIIAKS